MIEQEGMTPSRPYFIRAIYDWLVDNSLTPYLLVNAEYPNTEIPLEYVENGQIVLNISPLAARAIELGNEFIRFNARFGGTPRDIFVPIDAVLGLYARENGRGMLFPEEESEASSIETDLPESAGEPDPEPDPPPNRPRLRVVK